MYEKKSPKPSKSAKKTFSSFAEYWYFTKSFSDQQREIIINSLSKKEEKFLKSSYEKGGWEDLLMRNECDKNLDKIKEETGIDLLDIKIKALSGKSQLIHNAFWVYINQIFDKIGWDHIAYIFNGINIEPYDKEYVKISKI
jgi:hypothetical protein